MEAHGTIPDPLTIHRFQELLIIILDFRCGMARGRAWFWLVRAASLATDEANARQRQQHSQQGPRSSRGDRNGINSGTAEDLLGVCANIVVLVVSRQPTQSQLLVDGHGVPDPIVRHLPSLWFLNGYKKKQAMKQRS